MHHGDYRYTLSYGFKMAFCQTNILQIFVSYTGINPNIIRENTFDIQLILHDNSRVYLNNFFILARVSLFKPIKPLIQKQNRYKTVTFFPLGKLKFFCHVIWIKNCGHPNHSTLNG